MGWRRGGGGLLFEAGRLLNLSAFRMGAYSRLGAYSNKYGNLWPCGWPCGPLGSGALYF